MKRTCEECGRPDTSDNPVQFRGAVTLNGVVVGADHDRDLCAECGAAALTAPFLTRPAAPRGWPSGRYQAILADPPWRFVEWAGNGDRAPDNHYRTMSIEEISRLPVADLAGEDCAMFLWTTWPNLMEAGDVLKAWGFTYKTLGFCWVKVDTNLKPCVGLGYWTRANSEPCLFATKGHPKRLKRDVEQIILDREEGDSILAPRREHSRKPDITHDLIRRLVDGPYCELFARCERPGWDVWGNQTGKFSHQGSLWEEEGIAA